jgi:hypothetical protein
MAYSLIRAAAWALSGLLVFGAASCVGAAQNAWQFGMDGTLTEVAMPSEAVLRPVLQEADLDGDGVLEYVCLSEGVARIQVVPCGSANTTQPFAARQDAVRITPRWQSPDGWQVTQLGLGDLDHSGLPEVSLLVWRPFEPWPIDRILLHPGRIDGHQDADGMSCHVILIGWRDGQFREVWAGSALADPLLALALADLDNDGRPEFAALESAYDETTGPAPALTVWGWNGFGFDLLARAGGRFNDLSVFETPAGAAYLMTQ